MDINEVKKFIQNKIDSDKLTQKVRDIIKEKKWEKQDLKEGFKESFKPLIKAQTDITETIKKENAETIEQLEKNQLALTQGLLANRLALTQGLQTMGELMAQQDDEEFVDAEPGSPQPGPSTEQPPRQPRVGGPRINLEAEMNQEDIANIEYYDLSRPKDFLRIQPNNLKDLLKKTNKIIQSSNGEINGFNRKKNKTIDDITRLENLKKKRNTFKKYKAVLSTYLNSLQYQQHGTGIYFNNPHQLVKRLELLAGSILAGNNGVKQEFSQLAHLLKQMKIISTKQLNDLLKIYLDLK